MCKKIIFITSLTLVLNLVDNVHAMLPAGWLSQDIGITEPGSADERNGTWTVTGNGNDIWDKSDAFHYAFVQLNGDGEISACVVDNGRSSDEWAKGGVMIRETLDADSRHAMMIITDSAGVGLAFQSRFQNTGASSSSLHEAITTVSLPHWVKLVREGDIITAYHSDDGVDWELFTAAITNDLGGTITNPIEIPMSEQVFIGLCVTSHYLGELRTYTFDNVSIRTPIIAFMPDPADGSLFSDKWVNLSWQVVDFAVSHDIYFGENFEDVNNGTGNTFQGNQTYTHFDIGVPGSQCPDGLESGVTYYWRIDEVEADGTIHKGNVWSFTTVSQQKAADPIPSDGVKFVDYSITLNWIPGFGGVLHDIYFGDNFIDVTDGTGSTFRGYTEDTQFDVGMFGAPYPQGLSPGTNYYWRIDEIEVDGQTTHKGDVWSFTTARAGGGLEGQYYQHNGATPHDPPSGAFRDYILTRTDSQIDFNWGDGSPDPSINSDDFAAIWTGEIEAVFTETYTFYTNTDDEVKLWVGDQLIIDDWTDHSEIVNHGTIDLVASQKYPIEMWFYDKGGAAVAQLFWESPRTPKQIVPQAALVVSFSAYYPSPEDGATDVRNKPVLRWTPGGGASQHDVYLGTNFGDVNDADIFDDTGTYRGRWNDAGYATEKLNPNQTYFWRIDEYNADGTLDRGKVWRFTVGDIVEETVEYQVSSSQDDGYATGMSLQNLNSEYMKVGASRIMDYTSGMLFRDVNISQGAEIVSAHLKIRAYSSRLTDLVYGTIQAEATDDARFDDSSSIGSLPKTNGSVEWDLDEPWLADTWYTSPDVSSVIQEVIDRGDWLEGNSLAILYSTRLSEGGYRQFSSFDRGGDSAPILEITYVP